MTAATPPRQGSGKSLALLTRHGLSEHNLNTRVFMGRAPHSRLTDAGRAQAGALGQHLARSCRVDQIVSSSILRCVETAAILAECLGVPAHPDDALAELSKGDWEGRMPRDGVPEPIQRELDADPFHFRFPGGESFADAQARAAPAFDRWEQRFKNRTVLYVLHADILAALLQHVLGFPHRKIRDYLVAPCSLTRLERLEGRYLLLGRNEAPEG